VTSLGHRKSILAAIQQWLSQSAPAQEEAPAPVSASQPAKLGHFELLEHIGSGGMGIVYRAWDTSLNRQVALKVLDRSVAASEPQFFADFIREAQNAAGINHPNIVQIYFIGEDAGEYYIAMELLEGQTLYDRLLRGPMDDMTVLKLATQAVEALSATNARRLIHGDIKPQNLFLTATGDLKLLDFGLARKGNTSGLTDGTVFGSAYFISPERACGHIEDFRSDIYSLGVTMFYAISGMHPFEGDDLNAIALKRVQEEAPLLRSVKPHASPALERLLQKMMARDPAARPESYGALLADIAGTRHALTLGFDPTQKVAFSMPGSVPAIRAPRAVAPPVIHAPARAATQSLYPDTGYAAAGSAPTYDPATIDVAPRHRRKEPLWKRIRNNRFLLVSIIAHALFILVATVFVVQNIVSRKLTFTSAPATPNPSERSLEHEVSMAKKHSSMGAPVQARRIATTGISKITLPDMPSISTSTDFTPGTMAGMGGFGEGMGLGMGGAGGGGGGGGGGLTMFGMRDSGMGLAGHFYDLKQLRNRRPSGMTKLGYTKVVQDFVRNGWHEGDFAGKYYRASTTLYAPQIFTPKFPAELAPQAFGVQREVKPMLWVALYRGMVSPPETGSYHFVGAGDDVLIVRFNGQNVLDRCFEMQEEKVRPVAEVTANYKYDWIGPERFAEPIPNGFARGPTVSVTAGQYYPIEILIGEQPGGESGFALLMEKEGVQYQKDDKGNPILPVFRFANSPLIKPLPGSGSYPVHMDNGPIWESKPPGLGDDDLDSEMPMQ
jgi:serine/threonine protein kinase